jgi:hypothetical protein
MSDGIGIYTKLDRLAPAEKMKDSREKMALQENSSKRKGRKSEPEEKADDDPEKEETSSDPSQERRSGKILDVVI